MSSASNRKRGAKTCPVCATKNGARAFHCRGCARPFKRRHKHRRHAISEWQNLAPGSRVRVVGASGPYYVGADGARSYMSDKGIYTVVSTDNSGIHTRNASGSYTYLYMGPEMQSDLCHNLYRAPHKLLLYSTVEARPG